MNQTLIKLSELGPEMAMLVGACLCLVVGLHRSAEIRKLAPSLVAMALIVAGLLTALEVVDASGVWTMATFVKMMVCGIGMLLVMFMSTVPDAVSPTGKFNPSRVMRGEFFAFFLFSLTGVMLCGGANDLVWLFLALELTSLPTYVMIVISRDTDEASESGIKYFFLGAVAAAVFLYGFTMIYGATGMTNFDEIRQAIAVTGVTPLLTLGLVLSIVGIGFKIAAFPMHFYAADVYQGAMTPVTAFLAFVPKTAGFVSLIALLSLVTQGNIVIDPVTQQLTSPLPPMIASLLWVMAALTMTLGNVLGLMQTNVKRILAYSSISHSGYMLVGLLGMSAGIGSTAIGNGAAAVLFYLVAYALGNLAAFAVLSCLQRNGEEATELDALSGLAKRHPGLAAIMLLSCLSLVGLPPMVGFIGKVYLFGSAVQQGFAGLVIVAVVNSAISAVYYLRIVSSCYFGEKSERSQIVLSSPYVIPLASIAVGVAILLGMGFGGNSLAVTANQATTDSTLFEQVDVQLIEQLLRTPAIADPAIH